MSTQFKNHWTSLQADLPPALSLPPEFNWLPGEDREWTPEEELADQGFTQEGVTESPTLNRPLISRRRFPGYICATWDFGYQHHIAVFDEGTWICVAHWSFTS